MSSSSMKIARLEAEGGICVDLLNYGATIQSLFVPGRPEAINVVLGYPNPQDYLNDPFYLGCTLGRYAGRIDSGRFELNGQRFQLEQNDSTFGHCLHSASAGFSKVFWGQSIVNDREVVYEHFSADGEGGFPGNLECRVSYRLASSMCLEINYEAVSDADTVLNLSNHSYFNLSGAGYGIEDHRLWIDADCYLPMADNMLPRGDVLAVDDTGFDFRQPGTVASGIKAGGRQVELAGGIDHFYLLNHSGERRATIASVSSPQSGISMRMTTTQPGVQCYTGNSLSDPFFKRAALCLEFQTAPDAPNHPGFPSALLKAGEPYRQRTTFAFDRNDKGSD